MLIELERLDLVSPERVDFVEKCFRDIGRVDLSKKVTAYKMSGETIFLCVFLFFCIHLELKEKVSSVLFHANNS